MTPATYAALAHDNYMLLTALWRNIWAKTLDLADNPKPARRYYRCQECGVKVVVKHEAKHQPGCALFGQDPALLAQLDAFDAMPEVI